LSIEKKLRIKNIKFTSGEQEGGPPLVVSQLGKIVLIVGPNNSGKTMALREIHELLGPLQIRTPVVVKEMKIECDYTKDELWDLLGLLYPLKHESNECVLGRFGLKKPTPDSHVSIFIGNLESALNAFVEHGGDEMFRDQYLQHQRFHIRAIDRLEILKNQPLGNLRGYASNFIEHMMKERRIREKVREITQRVFGLHFVVDQLYQNYTIRLGHEYISLDDEERRSPEMILDMDKNTLIETYGDGIKAFLGLIILTITTGHRFIFIDDPEVYLHPPKARSLGFELSRIIEERKAQLFISTHSSEFLQGCIESLSDISIIRLTYNSESDKGTVKQIAPESLNKILHDRLLRSTGVFDALFHEAAVVVESESDRVFYDEINRRLVEVDRGSGDTLFINVHDWQTTGVIAGPLREIGIPTAVIIDIDTLRNQAAQWRLILDHCKIPQDLRTKMTETRDVILIEVPNGDDDKKNEFKRKGLDFLTPTTRTKTSTLIESMAEYGIFIVPVGELECWLPSLGISERKSKWVRKVFERMGATADADNYLTPGDDEVWKFLDDVAKWIGNSSRKGM